MGVDNNLLPIDGTTLLGMFGALVIPWLVSLIKAPDASPRKAAWFTAVVCLVWAGLSLWLGNEWLNLGAEGLTRNQEAQRIAINILFVLFTAWQLYSRFLKPTGIAGALEATGPQLLKPDDGGGR